MSYQILLNSAWVKSLTASILVLWMCLRYWLLTWYVIFSTIVESTDLLSLLSLGSSSSWVTASLVMDSVVSELCCSPSDTSSSVSSVFALHCLASDTLDSVCCVSGSELVCLSVDDRNTLSDIPLTQVEIIYILCC